jgi:uncharacterized protein (TIGR03083 family)
VATSYLPLERYSERIEEDSALLAGLLDEAGWDLAVPTCPGWRMEELVRHLGAVHRWALTYVSQGLQEMFPQPTEDQMLGSGPCREELATWLRAGATELAAALRQSPPDLHCWSFLPAPSPVLFWARRQAHETAIHRVDGQLALGTSQPLPADFAADGVSELLLGFAHRSRRRLRRDPELAAVLDAEDTDDRWRFAATPDGLEVEAGSLLSAPTTVRAPAHRLYLVTWNRLPLEAVALEGSSEPLTWLRESLRVTWG